MITFLNDINSILIIELNDVYYIKNKNINIFNINKKYLIALLCNIISKKINNIINSPLFLNLKSLIKLIKNYLINKFYYRTGDTSFIVQSYLNGDEFNVLIKLIKIKLQIIGFFNIDIIKTLKNTLNLLYSYKQTVTKTLKFIKFLIKYLISKYYYKLNEIDFIIKSYTDRDTFNFFVQLNRLKSLFYKEKVNEAFVKFAYYYLITFIFYIYYIPITWFLLKVLTDPQNWMLHCFVDENLALAL